MALDYPVTRTDDQVDDYHGTPVADPYRWLEDSDSPDTRGWIAQQNRLTESWLAAVDQRAAIRERLSQLWDHPRAGAPFRRGRRWFQLRNSGLQNQDVLWTMSGPGDEGEVLLDPNLLSEDGTVALAATAFSDDGSRLAYALSRSGSDWMTWQVREVDSGEDLPDRCEWSKFAGAAWSPDGRGFYYARYDPPRPGEAYEQTNRNQRLHYHRVGEPQDADMLVYARPDQPEWGFDPHVTEDGRYLVLHVWQGTDRRNRVFYRDLQAQPGPVGEVVELLGDFDAGYDLVGNDGPELYFVTDQGAPRRRVVAVDVRDPRRSSWREVIAQADDTLERASLLGGRLVALYLRDASHRVAVHALDGAAVGDIPLPGLAAVDALTGRQDGPDCCFTATSFTFPTAVYHHDLDSGATIRLVPPGLDVDPDAYVTEQVFATSRDGTRVPMFLVRRRDLRPGGADGSGHPTLLWGYGGFNIAVTPMFRVAWLVWLELGGVLAVANLRGGGEYGDDWHDAGRLANKQNVFDDFVACAEWLIGSGWTTPSRLGIQGGSNGGLLIGACLTQRPELFGACVPEVGVLDMLRFHGFTIGWAWTSDYGCADDPDQFRTLLAYSPLHNLRPGCDYPPTLITTGDHDDRVVPGHSFKFAAALQAAQAGDAPVLIRVQTDAGHGAGKPTHMLIDERADVLSFLVRALGLGG